MIKTVYSIVTTAFICCGLISKIGVAQQTDNSFRDIPKITISKETTWFTEPINENGEVDYWEAANRHFSKGVTPERNIVALIAQTARSYEWKDQPELRRRTYDMFGIKEMRPFDQLIVSFGDYCYELLDEDAYAEDSDLLFDLMDYPWSKEEYPFAAKWLEKYESTVKSFVSQLDDKTQFYGPLFAHDKNFELSLSLYEPGLDARAIGEYLIYRAMSRLNDGDINGCQADLIATRKLARILLKSHHYFGVWSGMGLLTQVANAEVHMTLNNKTSVQHLEAYRAEIAKLNFEFDISSFIDQNQRPFVLSDAITAKNGDGFLFEYNRPVSKWIFRSVRRTVNWDTVLKRINAHHDTLCRDSKSKPVAEQYKFINEYISKLDSSFQDKERWEITFDLLMSNTQRKSRMLADMIVSQSYEFNSDEQIEVWLGSKTCDALSRLNLELHYFYKQHGQYPESLNELVPRYLPSIPIDPCSGKAFKYKFDGVHFVLYSIGIDGQDDGGATTDGRSRLGYGAKDFSLTSNPDEWNKQYQDLQ